jgi:hypothetical protein
MLRQRLIIIGSRQFPAQPKHLAKKGTGTHSACQPPVNPLCFYYGVISQTTPLLKNSLLVIAPP